MKVNSNLISDIIHYYKEKLQSSYSDNESSSLLYTLIDHFFNISRLDLIKQDDMRLSESEMLKIHFAVKDLLLNKPIQYITGKVEFLNLELKIHEGILIPRPETEQLVQLILENTNTLKPGSSILDIGTGSGCIPLALKHHQRSLNISAIDISKEAIKLARLNAEAYQLEVQFNQIDVFDDLQVKALGKFDTIVSNPPYVRNSEKKDMQKNVLDFEPELALYVSDEDPLIYYERIAQLGKKMLNDNGVLYFEINENLGELMLELLDKYGYQNIQIKKDFNDRDRFVYALK